MIDEITVGFTGLKIVDPTSTDWQEGKETGISGVVQNASSDWRPHLPTPKCQLIKVNGKSYGDTESCTNFSATNDLATYLQYLVDTKQMPTPQLMFLQSNNYFDATGKINLSPRFSAITSGTTGESGNSLPQVWQTLRTVGIVPDQDCPMPLEDWAAKIATGVYTVQDLWAIWFDKRAVTAAATAKALEFLNYFEIQYQWNAYPGAPATPASLKNSLVTAPLQICTAVCNGWNTEDPIQACGAGTAHATELTYVETVYDIFDHYNPYQKQFALDYNITYAMQGIAVAKTVTGPTTYPAPANFKHTFTTQMDLGNTGTEITALQNALKTLNLFPLTVQSTGYYGTVTQTAVEAFQTKYGIQVVGRVGPVTIAELNKLVGA